MLNLNLLPPGGNGGLVRGVHYPLFVKVSDNKRTGFSKREDGSDADGTLLPTNFNPSSSLGTISSLVSVSVTTYIDQTGFDEDDELYAAAETKVKVAEPFVNEWKRLQSMKLLAHFPSVTQTVIASLGSIQEIFIVSPTRLVIVYASATSTLKMVVATVDANGLITGLGTETTITTAATAALLTSTHRSPHVQSVMLDQSGGVEKFLITYVSNVATSSNYYIRGRVMTVSGAAITAYTESGNLMTGYQTPQVSLLPMAANQAVLATTISADSSATAFHVISVDVGNNVTHGAALSVSGTSSTQGANMVKYSATKFVTTLYSNSGGTISAYRMTISGTTITQDFTTQVKASESSMSANSIYTNLVKFDGVDKFMWIYLNTGGTPNYWKAVTFQINALGTAFEQGSTGTEIFNSTTHPGVSASEKPIVQVISATEALVYVVGASAQVKLGNVISSVSVIGNELVVGTTGSSNWKAFSTSGIAFFLNTSTYECYYGTSSASIEILDNEDEVAHTISSVSPLVTTFIKPHIEYGSDTVELKIKNAGAATLKISLKQAIFQVA